MKFLVVCGHGLGSSFMVEMNAKQALSELGAPDDLEVEHSDLGSAASDMADIFICGRDLADNLEGMGELIVLDNILDKDELKEKLNVKLEEKNLI
ncbi:hypothetical protein GCM10007063_17770 [Lentibacillus kapialis]|uniref:PTS EIIB type-2 domain-containing protein n=1 Tax=Lentibacillus kapialis TaxID=340214 RepID=A0A917PWQ7_9BACI|nr:PTS sugar transporter subunit IIB [Lentibacillus kapialis]GGJ95774.1 hypothetical protein GCM10007063_17770 [Lentibacillus kapialis]